MAPLLAGLATAAWSAEPAPRAQALYGSKDYYPTPARPIGYGGDGSHCFPGATPAGQRQEGARWR
jgi:hypothetical protein